jgi:3-phenylpropionate/cinnamic acid dioxygenase small subunit
VSGALVIAPERLRQAELLQQEYVRVVDGVDLELWPTLFAREASYIVTSRENLERGHALAYVLDDSRDRIHDRVTYIQKVWKDHYNGYWPRHIIGPSVVTGSDGEDLQIETNVAIYISEPEEIGSRLLAVGVFRDAVTFEQGEAKFASKLVVLDTTVMPRYFVYPL